MPVRMPSMLSQSICCGIGAKADPAAKVPSGWRKVKFLKLALTVCLGGHNWLPMFHCSWIYEKAGLRKGRKVRQDVAAAYDAMWQSLEGLFLERTDWPRWPEQQDFTHEDQQFQDLIHVKPLKKEVIAGMYSPASVEIAATDGSHTDKPGFLTTIYGFPPLQAELTWTKRGEKRGLKTPEETGPVREKHFAKGDSNDLGELFRPAANNSSSGSTETPEAYQRGLELRHASRRECGRQ